MLSAGERPTRARRVLLGYLAVLAFLTYLDRACLASIKPLLTEELHLSMNQMSAIFSAFILAYGVFELPTGHWGDRIGRRRVLARIVAWWSAFTVATAASFNFVSLLIVRFLFGMGEAGAFPNAMATIARWVPVREQGTSMGLLYAMAHLGGAVTPLIVGALLYVMNWRVLLVLFGALGFVWVMAWWRWFRDDPAEHPAVNAAELMLIAADRPVPVQQPDLGWRSVTSLVNRSLVLLCLVYAANGYGFYFLITWLPDYLKSFHHFSDLELQIYTGLPLFLSVPADLLGGRLSDLMSRRFGVRAGRAWIGGLGYLCAAIAVVSSTWCTVPEVSAILFAVGAACSMATLGATWATCTALGRHATGTIGALMNSSSQIGSFFSPLVLSFLVQRYADWKLPIYLIGVFYAAAALAWLFIDSRPAGADDRRSVP